VVVIVVEQKHGTSTDIYKTQEFVTSVPVGWLSIFTPVFLTPEMLRCVTILH